MDDFNKVATATIQSQDKGRELLDKLLLTARPNTVFSEPVTKGDYTVITASEITVTMGYGFGAGGGTGPELTIGKTNATPAGEEPSLNGHAGQLPSGGGAGGGGGGMTVGRPVAAIIMGPNGVKVEPIVDPTKITLAFFPAFLGLMARLLIGRRRK